MRSAKTICLFLLAGITCALYGEVFSLWPFSKRTPASVHAADSIFNAEKLKSERVEINGSSGVMDIAIIDADPSAAFRSLKLRYPKGSAAMNGNALLFSTPPENGYVRKILIAAPDGVGKGVMFSMSVPEKGYSKHPVWPHELPLPSGADPVNVIRFTDRGSVYGQMNTRMSREEVLSNLAQQLKAQGWSTPGNESGLQNGSGDVFFSRDAKEVIVIGITQQKGSGVNTVSLYRRKNN